MCETNCNVYNNKGELIDSGGGGGGDLTSLENKTQNIVEGSTSPNNTTIIGNLTLNEPSYLSYGQSMILDFGTFINSFYSLNTSEVSGKGSFTMSAKDISIDCPLTTSQTTFSTNDLVSKAYVDSVAGGGIQVGTLATMLALTGMTEGQQFFVNANTGTAFTSQENKLYFWSGRTWQVSGETVELLAKENLLKGQVLQISGSGATADFQAERTTTTGDVDVIGIVANKDITAGEWFSCATSGLWEVACIVDTYSRANYLKAHTTDGYAQQTTSEADQPFAKILENRSVGVLGGKVFALLNIIAEVY
jgi:hypothetical protein